MHPVALIAARRTAIGSFQGSLASFQATEMGAALIRDILQTTHIPPASVDEVIIGQVLTAGCGQNPARQTAIKAGLPVETSAFTLNKVCGSGLKAVLLGAQAIRSGEADIILAGGQENMSSAPHLLPAMRQGVRMGSSAVIDSMLHDGLQDAFHHYSMGVTAEYIAERYTISRKEQDDYAFSSQIKAQAAVDMGLFAAETVPLNVTLPKGESVVFMLDEQPRRGINLDMLAQLKPAFKAGGSVTAGNSSSINDGAAIVMLASLAAVKRYTLPVMAYIHAGASVGVDPALMGLGPVTATRKALEKTGWGIQELERVEINEAFAVQTLAVMRDLGLPTDCVNVHGGGIALGHPIGASGARILVSLVHELHRSQTNKGLATLCIGGGQGIALAVERS